MTLRIRNLLLSVLTLIILISVIYIASHLILLRSFADLEERDVHANVERVLKALNIQLNTIAKIASGYSMWDDTYQFVSDANQDYIDLNMMDSTFADYDINLILYMNNALEPVFEKAVDLETGMEMPFPQSIYQHLDADSALVDLPDTESFVNGIVGLPEGYVMLSSQPVVTSEGHGPVSGIQIWGRFLDEAFFEYLAESTDFAITVRRFDALALPVDFELARDRLKNYEGVFVHALDNNTVAGYAFVEDVYGTPALVLRITLPRVIYAQGEASVGYFLTAMILSSVILAGFAQSRISLQEANDYLERRVEQRTVELSAANALLRQEIIERTQIEADLAQTRDQALEALRLKTQILANVSHDARTPLTTIMLRTELIQRGRYGVISDEQRKILDIILLNARQLLGFVTNLLTEAHFGGKPMTVAQLAFSPIALLNEVVNTMTPLAEQKQLLLMASVGSGVPTSLVSDPGRLQQILTNLLENAIRFTERGTIAVRIDRPDETSWTLQVSDSGRGIPKDVQERIFEAFWQLDGSMTREINRGVGLGLSIVRQLTTVLGGQITVNSELGQGATFTITFPLTGEQGETNDGPSPRVGDRG